MGFKSIVKYLKNVVFYHIYSPTIKLSWGREKSNGYKIQYGHLTLFDGDSTCFWVFYYERHVNVDTSDPFEWILCQFLSSFIENWFSLFRCICFPMLDRVFILWSMNDSRVTVWHTSFKRIHNCLCVTFVAQNAMWNGGIIHPWRYIHGCHCGDCLYSSPG